MKKLNRYINMSMIYLFPIIALILSLYAKETSAAARNALYLCLDVVIPSLFPFFVLSRLAIPYLSNFSCPRPLKYLTEKFFHLPYYTLITIILGYLSGYPTGAKLARDMFDEGLLDSHQASKTIAVANNCSPLFLIGTIGAGMFKSIKIGLLLLIIHWVSGLIASFFIGRLADFRRTGGAFSAKEPDRHQQKEREPTGFFTLVPSAVEEAAMLCIKVTGYIVLFAVLSELLARLGFFSLLGGMIGLFYSGHHFSDSFPAFMSAIFRGFMEITSGAKAISQSQGIATDIQLAAISLICGCAGFSVHTQVMGVMKGTKAKYRIFFTGKLLHGTIAGFLTLLVIRLVPITIQTSNISSAAPLDFSGIRLITIGTLLVSLLIAPQNQKQKKAPQR